MLLRVDEPLALLALPLAFWPWIATARAPIAYPWLALLPRDAASDWLDRGLRALASATLVAAVIGVAGPYRAEYPVERIGRGAEVVLLLDRSRSMDQAFIHANPAGAGPVQNVLDLATARQGAGSDRPSKGQAARRILSAFVAERREDRFATMTFSTLPIPVHGFTSKQDVVQAAIAAGAIGRGLSETDIGLALGRALDWFRDRPYTGSRIVLLVSDGGDHIDPDTRAELRRRIRDDRISLYWVYIRSPRSPKLDGNAELKAEYADTVPELFLHRFFSELGTPYRAYEADDPQSLERAIQDVSRLENLPITTVETIPRRDLGGVAFAVALGGALLLLGARAMELERWG